LPESIESSRELLTRWSAGDAGALAVLLEQEAEWVRLRVRRRLGPLLRAQHETVDVLQQAMLAVLRYRPPTRLTDGRQFRALLARLIENVVRAEYDHCTAQRRDRRKELAWSASRPHSSGEPEAASRCAPSRVVERRERIALLHLAVELLDPLDRELVLLHEFKQMSFAAIAVRLGLHEKAVQRAFGRALPRLAVRFQQLLGTASPGTGEAEV